MGKSTNLFRIALGIGGAVAAVALSRKDSRDKLKMNITNIKKILNHTKQTLKTLLAKLETKPMKRFKK